MSAVQSTNSLTDVGKPHAVSTLALLIIIALLVLVTIGLTAALIIYALQTKNSISVITNSPVRFERAVWTILNPELICTLLLDKCASANGSGAYGVVRHPSLGQTVLSLRNLSPSQQAALLVGAIQYSYNDASLIYGEIPQNRIYWAWTSYLYSFQDEKAQNGRVVISSSVGDSLGTGNVEWTAKQPFMAVVVSPNPNMFEVVRENAKKRFSWAAADNVQWFLQVIPTNMYCPTSDYCTFSRILLTDQNNTIPQWTAWHVSADDSVVKPPTLPVLPQIKTRSTEPSELKLLFPGEDGQGNLELWYQESINKMNSLYGEGNYDSTFARSTVPFISWLQDCQAEPDRCGLICGRQGLELRYDLRFDNNATLYNVNRDVVVPRGKKLVCIAIDHVLSTSVTRYCNLSFTKQQNEVTFKGVLTGNVQETGYPSVPVKALRTVCVTVPPEFFDEKDNPTPGFVTVLIVERSYVNPNGTGPWYSSTCPVTVYLVDENLPTPDECNLIQDYPYNILT